MTLRPPAKLENPAAILVSAGLALVYFGAARLGLLLASVHGNVSPVWPATGVALGALLLGGYRLWPGIALGAFAANALTAVPVPVAAGIAVGNTLEAILGAWITWRVADALRSWELGPLDNAGALTLASLLAPVVGATCGVLLLWLGDPGLRPNVCALWRTWWVGDALGALMVAPLMITLGDSSRVWRRPAARELLKAAAVYGAGAAVAAVIFFKPADEFLFAIFPVMLLAAAWLGSCGVKVVALLISAIGISAAFFGSGPFAGGSLNEGLLHLQLFLTSVAMAALVLPAFRAARSLMLAGGVLLVMWLISGWLFASLHQDRRRADSARLDLLIAEAEGSVRQRLLTYEDALRGGAGMLSAAKDISRAEWSAFARSVNLTGRYPGVMGIGVIFPVMNADAAAFVARVRGEGLPEFSIHDVRDAEPPATGRRTQRLVITYIEPEAPNREAIGLDVASEPNRRAAAEQSRDTGMPRISGRITLVQDKHKRAGFLLLMPIYGTESPLETVEQRRDALVAWIYSPFVTESFFAGVLGIRRDLKVRAYVGTEIGPQHLVYASRAEPASALPFERVTRLDLAGQTFTLGWDRGPQFGAVGQSAAVWAATCMALISLLVAGLVMSLHSLGQRAREIAAQRTAELAATGERLAALNIRLERKNAEFRNFAHTASHDLREPVRAVQGFSELLLEDYGKLLPGEGVEMLRRINGSTARMAALIENLLAYAEAESAPSQHERVSLEDVFQTLEQDLRPRIERVQGRIERLGALPAIAGNAVQLRQLFQNLIGNALKFHRQGVPPVVTISAEMIDANATHPRQVKITVADNGVGFAPEHSERIFQPFDRLHGASEFEGSGLGLAICKRVVERHGGEIHATGRPQAGATFFVTLPIGDEREDQPGAAGPSRAAHPSPGRPAPAAPPDQAAA